MTSEREAAAKAATQGEWLWSEGACRVWVGNPATKYMGDGIPPADARHMALNDPATILADIERTRKLEAVVEAARAYIADRCGDCGWQVCEDETMPDTGCDVDDLKAALKEVDDAE